jgi:hypothetical protein
MREIRTSGSEGGGAGNLTGPPYPYIPDAPTGLTFETPSEARTYLGFFLPLGTLLN